MNELLEKVVNTTQIGASNGGILNAEQSNRFLDYMWDATVLGNEARQVRMRTPEVDLDKISVGERIARKATEGTDDGVNADATFTKITLNSVKIRLDWELTTEGLEDNIERESLEDHVARLMATQLGNDLEDLAIHGDTGSADPLLKALEGWREIVLGNASRPNDTDAAAIVDAETVDSGAGLTKKVFNAAVKAMERKYLQRRSELRFYTSAGLIQDFLNGLTDRSTALGDAAIFSFSPAGPGISGAGGQTTIRPFGVPLFEVPLLREDHAGDYSGAAGSHGELYFTWPRNFIWGQHRDITVYREFKPKKDTIEYTVYTRMGVQVENLDSVVFVKNVKVQ